VLWLQLFVAMRLSQHRWTDDRGLYKPDGRRPFSGFVSSAPPHAPMVLVHRWKRLASAHTCVRLEPPFMSPVTHRRPVLRCNQAELSEA